MDCFYFESSLGLHLGSCELKIDSLSNITKNRISFMILIPVLLSFLKKEFVKDLRHVNNSISIFDFGYHFWSLPEVFLKNVLVSFILILLKVLNYMKNDNRQCSVLNNKEHGFNIIFLLTSNLIRQFWIVLW